MFRVFAAGRTPTRAGNNVEFIAVSRYCTFQCNAAMESFFGLPSVEMAPCRISYKNIPYRISTCNVLIVSMTHWWMGREKENTEIGLILRNAVFVFWNNHAPRLVSIDVSWTRFVKLKRMISILYDKFEMRIGLNRESGRARDWRYDLHRAVSTQITVNRTPWLFTVHVLH